MAGEPSRASFAAHDDYGGDITLADLNPPLVTKINKRKQKGTTKIQATMHSDYTYIRYNPQKNADYLVENPTRQVLVPAEADPATHEELPLCDDEAQEGQESRPAGGSPHR